MRIDLDVEVMFDVCYAGQDGEGHDAVDETARDGRIAEAGGEHGGEDGGVRGDGRSGSGSEQEIACVTRS